MLVQPPRVASCPVSRELLVHSNLNAVNSVRIFLVEIPSRGSGFFRTCRSRCRSSSSTIQVERLVVGGGGAKKRQHELRTYRASPISISAAEVEGSSDVDGISTFSHIPVSALAVETVVLESASASASVLHSRDAEAARDGEWQSLGRDGGVEHLSTSLSRNGLGSFNNNLGTVSSGTEFEAIQSTQWPVDHEDIVAEAQERNVEGLNSRDRNVPHPEFCNNATEEEEEDVGGHTGKQPIEHQTMSKRGSLGVRKPSQEPPATIDSAPWKSQVDNIAQRLEPPKSASTSEPESEEEFEYYIPKVGDYVTGVVISGNENQLDLDIGAKQLGLMLAKDVKPLDSFRTDEFFWELDESGTSMPVTSLGEVRFLGDREPLEPTHTLVPVGTVLTMQVYGVTFSGKPLFSARKVARRIAWQRVQQIHEHDEPFEAQCVAWNSEGLVLKIEGLRAVLPLNEFLNRSWGSGSLKEHVGEWKKVLITDADEATGKLLVSEKRSWAWRHLRIGSLVSGTVQRILPFGVEIIVTGTSLRGMLHISNISQCFVPDIKSIFTVGEKVKALLTHSGKRYRIGLSTAALERSKGLMLEDKERVYQEAEEMAAFHQSCLPTKENNEYDIDVDALRKFEELCPANQDWLDFGEGEVTVLDTSRNKQ